MMMMVLPNMTYDYEEEAFFHDAYYCHLLSGVDSDKFLTIIFVLVLSFLLLCTA